MAHSRISIVNDFGTLSERFGSWTVQAAQQQCLALASDTIDLEHLCACQLGQWAETIGGGVTCDVFHKGLNRVTYHLRVEPIPTQAALETGVMPILN